MSANSVVLRLLAALIVLAGCPKEAAPPPPPAAASSDASGALLPNPAVQVFTAFADKVCACPDMACANKVREAFDEENRRPGPTRQGLTAAELEQIRVQAKRLGACFGALSPR